MLRSGASLSRTIERRSDERESHEVVITQEKYRHGTGDADNEIDRPRPIKPMEELLDE